MFNYLRKGAWGLYNVFGYRLGPLSKQLDQDILKGRNNTYTKTNKNNDNNKTLKANNSIPMKLRQYVMSETEHEEKSR